MMPLWLRLYRSAHPRSQHEALATRAALLQSSSPVADVAQLPVDGRLQQGCSVGDETR